jgi:hypothetical protein
MRAHGASKSPLAERDARQVLAYLAPYSFEGGVVPEPVGWAGCGVYTGQAASADFSGTLIKPGKAKKLKIKGVPLPADAQPGSWWMAGVLVSLGCWPGSGALELSSGLPCCCLALHVSGHNSSLTRLYAAPSRRREAVLGPTLTAAAAPAPSGLPQVDVDCANNNGAPNFDSGTSYFNVFQIKG